MRSYKTNRFLVIALIVSWIFFAVAYSDKVKADPSDSVYEATDDMIAQILGQRSPERPSPKDRVKESQILVYDDRVVIDVKDAVWATFTDTNSMDPVIDKGSNAIEYVPEYPAEISVGDIVSYHSKHTKGVIIHRVIETGYDEQGWYAIMKGDNNNYRDPGKVRFDQIERVVIGIIY